MQPHLGLSDRADPGQGPDDPHLLPNYSPLECSHILTATGTRSHPAQEVGPVVAAGPHRGQEFGSSVFIRDRKLRDPVFVLEQL